MSSVTPAYGGSAVQPPHHPPPQNQNQTTHNGQTQHTGQTQGTSTGGTTNSHRGQNVNTTA